MRRWILVVLIVLLPLRAWAGAFMIGTEFAIKSVAHHADSARAEAHFDDRAEVSALPCHGHDAAPVRSAHGSTEHTDGVAGDGTTDHACNTCQVCHTSAMATEPPWQPAAQRPLAPPRAATARFVTLPVAPGLKPPIF